MESYLSLLFFLFHITFFLYIVAFLIRSFWFNKRQERNFKKIHLINELSLMILLFFCFKFVDMSSFRYEEYFTEFAGLLLLSVAFYWINKIDFGSFNKIKQFTLPLLGTLFWLSLFTTLKFAIYLPFCWYPLLGLMALSPIFFTLLSVSEIHYQTQLHPKISVYKIILFGLIPLIALQLIMNLYTPEPWELIKIFNPKNTMIF